MVQLGGGIVERVPLRLRVLDTDLTERCGCVAGLGASVVERVPVGPGLDLVEQCCARTLGAAHLAMAHQFVVCRH